VCDDGLSPLIHARPGKSNGNDPPLLRGKLGLLEAAADKVFDTVAGVLVTVADGSNGGRRLFVPNPETGRGVQKRGTFFGYVAVSEPAGPEDEVDVAFVWRGTNFKEEWESNVAQDKLVSSSMELQLTTANARGQFHYGSHQQFCRFSAIILRCSVAGICVLHGARCAAPVALQGAKAGWLL
jgi:hypothetical protein